MRGQSAAARLSPRAMSLRPRLLPFFIVAPFFIIRSDGPAGAEACFNRNHNYYAINDGRGNSEILDRDFRRCYGPQPSSGGFYTLNQYLQAKEADQRIRQADARNYALQLVNAELEVKKPFFSKQLGLCNDLTEAAATLVIVHSTKKDTDKNWVKYWVLLFGRLRVFAGPAVFKAAADFGRCLNGECDKGDYQLAWDLAAGCRAEIGDNWRVQLPPLKETPAQQRGK